MLSAISDILHPYTRIVRARREAKASGGRILLLEVPTALIGILIIALALVLAVAMVGLVHRMVPIELRKSHNPGLGLIMGTFGAMFAIIVGFAAFLSLSKYHSAQLIVQSEAANVHEVYYLAEPLPQPKREQIQGLAKSYARAVVEEEWPLMMRQGKRSPHADTVFEELLGSIQEGYKTSSDAQQGFYGQLLTVMDQLEEDRDTRHAIVGTGLPLIVWVALVLLGTLIVGFASLVDMEKRRPHLLAVCALATGIAVVLFTTFVLDYPFRTDISPVGPQPFELVLDEMVGESLRAVRVVRDGRGASSTTRQRQR